MVHGLTRTLRKKGAIERLYTAAPAGSIVVCLDEMGPQASKSYPGQRLVRPVGPKPERAKQEIDYGRRGIAGYVFGALQPATGEAFTLTSRASHHGQLGRLPERNRDSGSIRRSSEFSRRHSTT